MARRCREAAITFEACFDVKELRAHHFCLAVPRSCISQLVTDFDTNSSTKGSPSPNVRAHFSVVSAFLHRRNG